MCEYKKIQYYVAAGNVPVTLEFILKRINKWNRRSEATPPRGRWFCLTGVSSEHELNITLLF